jgi:nitrite reductase (NO-forming)
MKTIIIVILIILGGYFLLKSTDEEIEDITSSDVVVEENNTEGSVDNNEIEETINTSEDNTIQEQEQEEVDESVTETVSSDDTTESDVDNAKEFTIDSFNFGYSIDEIRVKEGDTVTIKLTNSKGFHDLVIDEFDVSTEAISEGSNTTETFVADKAGTYEFYCSIGNHRAQGMVGTLIVE